jgi:hypothetical protein
MRIFGFGRRKKKSLTVDYLSSTQPETNYHFYFILFIYLFFWPYAETQSSWEVKAL